MGKSSFKSHSQSRGPQAPPALRNCSSPVRVAGLSVDCSEPTNQTEVPMSHLKTDGRRALFVCRLLVLAAALLSTASDYGQTAATGATTNARTSPLPGRQIWVVGDKGFIAHTEDSGVTWKKQSSGTQTDFYSVCFFNSPLLEALSKSHGKFKKPNR